MKKPEAALWKRLRPWLEAVAFVQRHEDKYSPDIPDVSFQSRNGAGGAGWVELKVGRVTTKGVLGEKMPWLRLPHLRPGQVNWLKERGDAGGLMWLLVEVHQKGATPFILAVHGSYVEHDMREVGMPLTRWLEVGMNIQLSECGRLLGRGHWHSGA